MSTKREKQTFEEWEALLAGLRETAPNVRGTAAVEAILEGSLGELREFSEQRDADRAAAVKARQKMLRALARGKEAALRVRSYLKFRLGPYNDELVHFGIAPIRRGKGRKAAAAPPDAAQPVN